MIFLSCETSTLLGSVSLVQDGAILVEKKSQRQGSHSDHLHATIEQCLKEVNLTLEQIDFFCSGIGPGSFTGIRVSLNAIKSYSFILKKPCLGMDSLSNIAHQAHQLNPGLGPIVVIINAFKNMVYYSVFNSHKDQLVQTAGPDVTHVKELSKLISSPHLCLGDGYVAFENYLKENLNENLVRSLNYSDYPLSSTIALCQQSLKKSTWQDFLPIYLRSSEAEENLRGIKFTPL
jgi:tRNA threonylcarbamoyladenosine biosynthesis protein TsaB